MVRPSTWILLVATLAVLVWSFIGAYDRFTWILEVAPFLIALPILAATARRFPLTPLAYTLIAVHATILMIGGHYTYAQVPVGYWLKSVFGFSRNHYDASATLLRASFRRSSPASCSFASKSSAADRGSHF